MQIEFSCEPGREQELIDATLETIQDIQQNGASNEDLVKLKETYRRDKENAFRSNSWWLNRLLAVFVYENATVSSVKDVKTIPNNITSASMQKACKDYCHLDNYATVILEPEIKN